MKIEKQLRPYLYALGAAAIAIGLGVTIRQCTKKTDLQSQDAVKYVEVTPVAEQQLLRRINAIGKLIANQSIIIKTELPGRIAKIYFKDGQAVNAGDPLIAFDSEQARLEATQARAKASQMEQMFYRSKELFQKSLVSASEYEKAKAEFEQSKAQSEERALIVNKMTIKAPFEGIVGIREKDINLGAYINQNVDIVSLVDTDPMMVDFNVSGGYIGSIKNGQEILLTVDGTAIENQAAKVVAIDARVDEAGNTIKVRGEASNAKGLLKPGMFAKAKVVIGEVPNAIMVPEAAIERTGNQHYVYRVDRIQNNVGHVIFTPIVIGTRDSGMVEVISGLQPKEVVVIGGHVNLQEGQEVRIKMIDTSDLKKKLAAQQSASTLE
jgi:membrane fusion protein, multidrug efflux system